MNVFILYLLILTSWYPLTPVENPCGTMLPRYGDNDWGDGCFRLPKQFYITVYSDTSGSVYGMIKPYYSYFMLYDREDHEVNLNGIESESIGDYETVFIKFKRISNSNYIMVSWKNSMPHLFLSKTELDNYGIRILRLS